jgi:hypothetical protein
VRHDGGEMARLMYGAALEWGQSVVAVDDSLVTPLFCEFGHFNKLFGLHPRNTLPEMHVLLLVYSN